MTTTDVSLSSSGSVKRADLTKALAAAYGLAVIFLDNMPKIDLTSARILVGPLLIDGPLFKYSLVFMMSALVLYESDIKRSRLSD